MFQDACFEKFIRQGPKKTMSLPHASRQHVSANWIDDFNRKSKHLATIAGTAELASPGQKKFSKNFGKRLTSYKMYFIFCKV
jgi:hypothetical protein